MALHVQKVSSGVVHIIPPDMKKIFALDFVLLKIWEEITPLARNEWICWITSAKKKKLEYEESEL